MRIQSTIARLAHRVRSNAGPLRSAMRKPQSRPRKAANGIIIKTSQNDFNLAAYLGPNAPAKPYTVVINPGVIIGSTSTATAAFSTGSLPAGSTLKIINRGRIQGKGGGGGNGGNSLHGNGGPGLSGGPAMDLGMNILIDNGRGQIWGGGGGGGGGGAGGANAGDVPAGGGGGGGGGQGRQGGSGGTFGVGAGGGDVGTAGGVGETDYPGKGGKRGEANSPGSPGGDGGGPGQDGSVGGSRAGGNGQGGVGGIAGKAINLNGFAVTWRNGSASPLLQGAVS